MSADNILLFLFYFPRKQVLTFHANCLLRRKQVLFSSKETICMKGQNLFSGKNKEKSEIFS